MQKLKQPFKISARLISHLGEALISDELIALTELIKNSYDADANFSRISVRTSDTAYFSKKNGRILESVCDEDDVEAVDGKITILDNGNGMTLDIIKNHYLNIATDFKKKTQKISPKYRRLSLGNKGLGRLCLQRLGEVSRIVTKTDEGCYEFFIYWSDFEKENVEISSVDITITEIPTLEIFGNKNGTFIEIFKLKNIDLWNKQDTFDRLKKESLSIVNPFSEEESRFFIEFDIDFRTFSSEKYDLEYLRNLADVRATISFESSKENLSINVTRNKRYVNDAIKDLEKRLKERSYELIIDKEADFDDFISLSIFGNMSDYSIQYPKALNAMARKPDGNYYLPGNFSGEVLAYDKTPGRFSQEQIGTLKIQNGVKLFRNNFRILPYGEDKNDWMNFTKYSQTSKSVIFKVHTSIGYFYIDGEDNLSKLKEMTNRQGLVEDQYGKNFLVLISDLISLALFRSDADFRKAFNPQESLYKDLKDDEVVKFLNDRLVIKKIANPLKDIEKSADLIKESFIPSVLDSPEVSDLKSGTGRQIDAIVHNTKNLEIAIEAERQKIRDENERLAEFSLIVGASFVAESMAHEIHRITINTKDNMSKIRTELSSTSPNIQRINAYLSITESNMDFLTRHANILNINSYTKRRYFEVIDLRTFINSIIFSLPYFESKKVVANFAGTDTFEQKIVRSNLTIAVENIIINSVYWLNIFKEFLEERPTVFFEVNSSNKTLVIYDNGLGIDNSIENSLFEPLISKKPDSEARGYGLYITEKLLSEINCTIALSPERNKHNRRYKFVMNFL